MICPKCQQPNREGRKFCASCGAGLAAPCGGCGFANEPDEKFCGGCGKALTAAPAQPREAKPAGGERRQVTVLFADLAGYTKLSSTLDPEETHALLEKFFAVVDGTVMQYGGTIDKHIGDNVMAIFGAPVAHGDDPERAVRAAVEIHLRVDELSHSVGTALKVHIGLALGEVVASSLGSEHHDEYTVIGDSVNLAARLQDKAVAGETIVSDAVRRAAVKTAAFESMGELQLKGIAAPVRAWRITGIRAARGEAITPLVGREREISAITAACAAVAAERHGRIFIVRGEPGIGKTRLLEEVRRMAEGMGYRGHTALIFDFGTGKATPRRAVSPRAFWAWAPKTPPPRAAKRRGARLRPASSRPPTPSACSP